MSICNICGELEYTTVSAGKCLEYSIVLSEKVDFVLVYFNQAVLRDDFDTYNQKSFL